MGFSIKSGSSLLNQHIINSLLVLIELITEYRISYNLSLKPWYSKRSMYVQQYDSLFQPIQVGMYVYVVTYLLCINVNGYLLFIQ